MPQSHAERRDLLHQIAGYALFATAFGMTEAVLVIYARQMLHMPPGLDYAEIFRARGQTFEPSLFVRGFTNLGLYNIELAREAATLLMLAGVALAHPRGLRKKMGVFLWTFALWDLTFYAFLKILIGFPRTFAALDVYFLVPIVWFGPVWFPILVVMPLLLVLGLYLMLSQIKDSR